MRFIYNQDKISLLYNIKWTVFFFKNMDVFVNFSKKIMYFTVKKKIVRTLSISAINVAVNIDILLKGARCMVTSPTGTSSRQYRNTFGFG